MTKTQKHLVFSWSKLGEAAAEGRPAHYQCTLHRPASLMVTWGVFVH